MISKVLQFKVFIFLLHFNGFQASTYNAILDMKSVQQSEIPSRILINYLSNYFGKSDMFVKVWMSSDNINQDRLQLDLIDTIIGDRKLSNFTFELITHIGKANDIRLIRGSSSVIQRAAFDLFIVDSFKSFK